LLLAQEGGLLGQGQVHPGRLHRRQRHDGAGQLALQPALEVQAFLELGGAELLVLHQLEAHRAALGQALGGQAQPHLVHLGGRHQDGAAALGELVRHVHLRQRRDDGAAVLVGQVGVQHAPLGLTSHEQSGEPDGQKQGDPQGQAQFLALVHGRQALGERRVQRNCRCGRHRVFRCSGMRLCIVDGIDYSGWPRKH